MQKTLVIYAINPFSETVIFKITNNLGVNNFLFYILDMIRFNIMFTFKFYNRAAIQFDSSLATKNEILHLEILSRKQFQIF